MALAFWNDVFVSNHYAQLELVALGDGTFPGPAVRIQDGSTVASYSGYHVFVDPGALTLYKGVNVNLADIANLTQIGQFVGTINPNDAIRIEAEGSTIRVKQNGVVRITVTDAALTGGKPGIVTAGSVFFGADGFYDNWAGGDLAEKYAGYSAIRQYAANE